MVLFLFLMVNLQSLPDLLSESPESPFDKSLGIISMKTHRAFPGFSAFCMSLQPHPFRTTCYQNAALMPKSSGQPIEVAIAWFMPLFF
jgi:hypothetical protein